MGCFGCKDLSTLIASSSHIGSTSKRVSNPNSSDKDKAKRKIKPAQRVSKLEQVLDARKKDQLRKKAGRPVINYVFVGNLEPTVTRDELSMHFRLCGRISKIEIRCSRGQAVNVGIPNGSLSPRDRKYATIEFRDPSSVAAALKKNGSVMAKQQNKIIVCTAAADLPEVAEIVTRKQTALILSEQSVDEGDPGRIDKLQGPKPVPRMVKMKRYLEQQPTEPDLNNPKSDKFRIWGFSFAKTII